MTIENKIKIFNYFNYFNNFKSLFKNSNKFMNTNNLFLDYFYMTFYFSKTTFNLFNYFYKK